jgi:hypothetical protein
VAWKKRGGVHAHIEKVPWGLCLNVFERVNLEDFIRGGKSDEIGDYDLLLPRLPPLTPPIHCSMVSMKISFTELLERAQRAVYDARPSHYWRQSALASQTASDCRPSLCK